MSRQHISRACKNGAPKPPKNESADLSKTFKSNFDEVVENIAMKSKKTNYNSKTGMNWCYLPTEMRHECVKHLDFKTRCGFRGVSKSEKALVELEKYKFELLKINFKDEIDDDGINIWDIVAKSGNEEPEIHIRTKGRLNEKFLSAIFKYAEVKNFRLSANNRCNVRRILDQLAQFAPFPFKRVSVFGNRSIDFFMQNCPNLGKVDVYGQLPYENMLNLPSLMEIKEFKLFMVRSYDLLDFVPGLVQKWIDNDVEVGKSVQCFTGFQWNVPPGTRRLVDRFFEKFAERIIEGTDKVLRIRMNNPTTQILMRSFEPDGLSGKNDFCSCKVVPIDMPKSEYATGDGWIQAFYEKFLKMDGKLEKAMEFDPEDRALWGNFFSSC